MNNWKDKNLKTKTKTKKNNDKKANKQNVDFTECIDKISIVQKLKRGTSNISFLQKKKKKKEEGVCGNASI